MHATMRGEGGDACHYERGGGDACHYERGGGL